MSRRTVAAESRAAAVQSSERCNNMRNTIALKRQREAALDEGKVAGLRLFEATDNAQCLGR